MHIDKRTMACMLFAGLCKHSVAGMEDIYACVAGGGEAWRQSCLLCTEKAAVEHCSLRQMNQSSIFKIPGSEVKVAEHKV